MLIRETCTTSEALLHQISVLNVLHHPMSESGRWMLGHSFTEGPQATSMVGVTFEWSQGPVERLNNRTKFLTRRIYGQTGLPLLSARILHG